MEIVWLGRMLHFQRPGGFPGQKFTDDGEGGFGLWTSTPESVRYISVYAMQFLIEAMLLSLMGGAAGILAGVVASKIVSTVADWPILLRADVIIAAFVFSAAVGIFFGYYPARQASRLNPIDALRYE